MSYCILYKDNIDYYNLKNTFKNKIKDDYDENNPDAVIAVGGDGTIIRAVHTYPNALIFGLNAGHLGYYCKYSLKDLELLINDINNKSYMIEKIPLLKTKVYKDNKAIIDEISINESVILSPLKTLQLEVRIDDYILESFKGNGLCFSTSYGSTGFNRSLNGAIVDRELNVIQMTEIAGINSTAYKSLSSPLVIGGSRRISLKPMYDANVYASVDNIPYELSSFDEMCIRYDGSYVRIAYHIEEGFIKRLNRAFINELES